jgi:hypothetical protein
MSDEGSNILNNIDGVPISYPIMRITDATIDGVSSFLGKICMPAAEEAGLLLKDHLRAWRAKNMVMIVEKSKGLLVFDPDSFELKASPRVVWKILENGSWTEDENLQNMWAGLLASSCTEEGKDESNLIYIDLLSRITPSEAHILNNIGEKCSKDVDVLHFDITVQADQQLVKKIPYLVDFDHLARELNHLESLGLIKHLNINEIEGMTQGAFMQTTRVALDLYVRCNGSSLPTREYFAQFFENTQQ